MRIGLMGGTFDPIHLGHLMIAERAREEAGLDEVWFMPVNVPPHKPQAPRADARQRWEMAQLAVSSNPAFKAVDIELNRGGTSYTADTIDILQSRYPEAEFFYIIGADMVMYLPKWHRIEELADRIVFLGLARPGYDIRLEELDEKLKRSVKLLPMLQVDISSTDIRSLRKDRRSVRYLVTDPVRAYMEENGLYEG